MAGRAPEGPSPATSAALPSQQNTARPHVNWWELTCGCGGKPDCENCAEEQRFALRHGAPPMRRKPTTRTAQIAAPNSNLSTADADEPESVEWWWPGYIPIGKPGILDGDPGLGKSTIWADFAASMTTGRALPDGTVPSITGGVLIFASEDGYRDTIIPRLIAAGADRKRILVAHAADHGQLIELPRDLAYVETLMERIRARLVVFDPLEAYLAADIIKGREQRLAMDPVVKLFADRQAVMLGTRHLNQQSGQRAQYRGRGDITQIGLVRWGLIVGPDPKSEDQDAKVMVPHKHNLAKRRNALKYQIVTATVNDGIETSRIQWNGDSDVSADQAIGADAGRNMTTRQVLEEKVLPLLKENGPMPSQEAFDILRAHGASTSDSSVKTARSKLEIKARKQGMSGPWWWLLDGQAVPQAGRAPEDYNPQPQRRAWWAEDPQNPEDYGDPNMYSSESSRGNGALEGSEDSTPVAASLRPGGVNRTCPDHPTYPLRADGWCTRGQHTPAVEERSDG